MGGGGLVCYSPWGHKESDTTERLNWTELNCGLWELFVKMYFACFCLASRTASSLGLVTFNQAPHLWPLLMTTQLSRHSGLCFSCHWEEGLWHISSTTRHGWIVLKHFWSLMVKQPLQISSYHFIVILYKRKIIGEVTWFGHFSPSQTSAFYHLVSFFLTWEYNRTISKLKDRVGNFLFAFSHEKENHTHFLPETKLGTSITTLCEHTAKANYSCG